jgi:branched-chain amino acid transport system substrate-binding protein
MKFCIMSIGAVKGNAVGAILASAVFATSAIAQDGPVKLGVLTDMSSLYADNGGQGSVVAADGR